jgi:hypothetical protein
VIARDWVGETCFIIAGGPSVATQPYERLRGRKVIIINSSYERAPWADILVFHDERWWREHKDKLLPVFAGQIFTTWPSINHPRVVRLRNSKPQRQARGAEPLPLKLSDDPRAVPMRRTSITAALNIAVLKGATSIVIMGADGKFGPNGERNHHRPHKWRHNDGCWDRHYAELKPLAAELTARGIDVRNASPGSAWDLWPIVTLESIG